MGRVKWWRCVMFDLPAPASGAEIRMAVLEGEFMGSICGVELWRWNNSIYCVRSCRELDTLSERAELLLSEDRGKGDA